MKVICAPDSFKETISAMEAADAIAEGARRAVPHAEIDLCPVGDGGEGTLDAIINARGGSLHEATVTGPLGERTQARYGILDDGVTGIIELAQASGLAVVPRDRRNPTRTTTFGTGELIRHAAARGCHEVIVCLGGSATVDGGAGIAQALGAVFYDENDVPIDKPMTGGLLMKAKRVTAPNREKLLRIRIACDVTNPLRGPNGAAAVYGPQKGATPKQVELLEVGLRHLASILRADPDTPGFGAAGGAAVGLVMLCNAQLERGINLVLETLGFDERCRNADLVLTGEGSLDAQSLHGKATIGVAKAAARLDVPTIALVGRAGEDADRCVSPGLLEAYVSLTDRCGADAAMNEPARCLAEIAADVVLERFEGTRGGKL